MGKGLFCISDLSQDSCQHLHLIPPLPTFISKLHGEVRVPEVPHGVVYQKQFKLNPREFATNKVIFETGTVEAQLRDNCLVAIQLIRSMSIQYDGTSDVMKSSAQSDSIWRKPRALGSLKSCETHITARTLTKPKWLSCLGISRSRPSDLGSWLR